MGALIQSKVSEWDESWMVLALEQARLAQSLDEVPVGAVLVQNNKLIASAHNSPIGSCDASAHAEINVIREAGAKMNNYRLPHTCLYVTLEPCTMCLGAIVHARIHRVVFATAEPRAGAIISAAAVDFAPLNHSIEWTSCVMAQASKELLQAFFHHQRARSTRS